MKKIYIALIAILLLVIPFSVYAKQYSFRGLTVTFNNEWNVFTRDNISGNEKLKEYGTTEEYMKEMFEKQKVYCEAVLEDLSNPQDTLDAYIQIISLNSQKINFNNLEDEEIIKSGEELSKGTNADEIDAVTIGKNKYATFKYKSDIEYNGLTGTFNILQYYTIQDDVLYSFKFQKYNPIAAEDEWYAKSVLETVNIYKSNKPSWIAKALAAMLLVTICSIGEAINISKKKKRNAKQEDKKTKNDFNNDKEGNNLENGTDKSYKNDNCDERLSDDNRKKEKTRRKKPLKSDINQKYSDLNKLKKLLDKDIITKEEFEKEKKKILKD